MSTPNSGSIMVTNKETAVSFSNMQYSDALSDLLYALKSWRIWLALSWEEFRSTYRRSLIGVSWVMLSFFGFIFVKLVIFSSLVESADGQKYNAFMVLGLFVWTYIVNLLNSASNTFTSAQGFIKSEKLPLMLYVFKAMSRELYNFLLTFVVVILALVYIKYNIGIGALYAIPGFIFLILNSIWIKVILGTIGARIRDVGHLVSAVTLPLMFLTPVFWMPSQMPKLMEYLWWNPFYHYLELFRAPILGEGLPVESWIISLILFGVGNIFAFLLFARFRQRIVFWF
ncbi:ABC transporter permease [Hellea sp.]|nr:ABC transporter permease [Hellea sp.]MDA9048107.1 ABC transporter permease [Hellea sp.]